MFEIGIFRQRSLKISVLDLRRTESSGTGTSSLTGGRDFHCSFFTLKKSPILTLETGYLNSFKETVS